MHDYSDDPLRLPAAVPAPGRPALPLAAAIVPVVGAVILWRITGSTFALWFAALGPLMATAGFLDGLRTNRRAQRRARRDQAAALTALRSEIERRHDDERHRARRRTPDVAGFAADPDEIWRAVPGRDEVIVVGRGTDRSAVRIDGEPSDDSTRTLRAHARVLEDAPIAVPLRAGIAVCGPPRPAAAVVRALVTQVCLAHPPGEVRMTGDLTGLGHLPHADATRGTALFVGTSDQPVPDEAEVPIVRVAEGSPPPPRCSAILTLLPGDQARLDHDGRSRTVHIEAIALAQAAAIGASLTARAETLGQRPRHSVDFSQLPTCDGGRASLAAAVGMDGHRPAVLDLVADGPHAVVIGVTGSGKSELLTTWIVGMCRTRTPQELSLLLIDFKGGRTFDALLPLPHVTGVLTDLTEDQTLRAVESLRAEIRHRERVLAGLGARDISEGGDALSRLVVVIDEYAALVAVHPEWHDLFADIAARGRALGIHLIIATQRAAGAIRDGVLANAPLRLALRVTDAADSRAVIGQDDAVRLPGTASARGMTLVRRAGDSAPHTVRVARCLPEELSRVCAEVAERTRGCAPVRRPWLAPLPARLELSQLRGRAQGAELLLGLVDEPGQQRQRAAALPAGSPGLAVIGGAGGGRTNVLATIAAQAAHALWVPQDREGAWDALAQIEGASPGTAILIDDADAIAVRLPGEYGAAWVAAIERTCRDARSRGVVVVLSVARISGGLGRVIDLLPHRALLGMPTRADHVAAGGESADFVADLPPGRGRWGRHAIQFAIAAESVREGAAPAAPGIDFAVGGALGFVVAPGPAAREIRAAAERAGRHVRAAEEVASSALAPGDVIIASAEEWLAQWRLLAHVRAEATLIVDAECAGEYRALTTRRELPPLVETGRARAWLLAPGEPVRRVILPRGGTAV